MTSRTSKLVLAALLASSLPAVAAARDCEHDRDGDHRPPVYVPPPAYPAPPAPAPDRWREDSWRDGSWRERELREVRAELRALDQRRAEFHARFAWNPGKVRRFERRYALRRAELERRWYELQYVAWR